MKDQVWETDFEGCKIKVINRRSIFPPCTSETLEIDGIVVENKKSSFSLSHSTITTKYNISGVEREVEIRIANKAGGFGIGCQILVDGDIVGGDKAIRYPDPERDRQQIEKGYFRYFISVGLLNYGLPYASIMLFLNMNDPIVALVLKFVFHALFFGGVMSYFTWRGIKSRVDITLN